MCIFIPRKAGRKCTALKRNVCLKKSCHSHIPSQIMFFSGSHFTCKTCRTRTQFCLKLVRKYNSQLHEGAAYSERHERITKRLNAIKNNWALSTSTNSCTSYYHFNMHKHFVSISQLFFTALIPSSLAASVWPIQTFNATLGTKKPNL